MKKADRTVVIGVPSIFTIIVLLIGSIVCEIFYNIYHIVPIIFAIYTIANATLWTAFGKNPKYEKNTALLRYIIGWLLLELIFIIPYIMILFIESFI